MSTAISTNTVTVDPVLSKAQQKQFLNLPASLYAGNPNWIPKISSSEREMVGFAHHPFYDSVDSQAFLATKHGQLCGRILALKNRIHDEQHPDESIGFIGFFETTNDEAVAHALFDAAFDWLRDKGCERVRGPVSPSMNYEAGLVVDGFDCDPTFMMPYSADYYPPFWDSYGFEGVQDLFAFVGDQSTLGSLDGKVAKLARAAKERFNVMFRPLNPKKFQEDAATFLRLYNQASQQTWGFVPLSEGEIQHLSGELKHLIVPGMTCIGEVDGEAVGAVFCILDFNPIIRRIKGKLFPFGFLQIMMGKRSLKRSRVMSINVLPEYQRWGLGASLLGVLFLQGVEQGMDHISEVEFSYVLESNHLARMSLENGGAKKEKTYRIYEKSI